MLDIKRIRERPEEVRKGLAARGADVAVVDVILSLDSRRRELLTGTETRKASATGSRRRLASFANAARTRRPCRRRSALSAMRSRRWTRR